MVLSKRVLSSPHKLLERGLQQKSQGENYFPKKVNFIVCCTFHVSAMVPLIVQNLIATKLGVQKITGITLFDMREKRTYDSLLDLEVSYLYCAVTQHGILMIV